MLSQVDRLTAVKLMQPPSQVTRFCGEVDHFGERFPYQNAHHSSFLDSCSLYVPLCYWSLFPQ